MNEIPHRKNAAEWLMWIALQPIRWINALFVRRP
jgi:hypothetical protein